MKIYIAADHGGFELKNQLREHLTHRGYEVTDCGAETLDPEDDYPQYAYDVTAKLLGEEDNAALGILVCKSGEGMAIAANRVHGIRAALVWDVAVATETRQDNDSNVLVLPSKFVDSDTAIQITEAFLAEKFSGAERHKRRIQQVEELYG